MKKTLVVVAVIAAGIHAALAQTAPDQSLKRVEQDLANQKARQESLDKQAETLSQELLDLRNRLVSAADETARLEDELNRLEDQVVELETDEKARAERLAASREQISALLGALQKLARTPTEALLARPGGPVDAARSALLLSSAVPPLRAQAETLATELKALADTRERLAAQRQKVTAARQNLAGRQQDLAALVEKRTQLSRRTDAERSQVLVRMSKLAGQAADLRQLMEKIEAERREVERRDAERRDTERREAERRAAEQRRLAQEADRTRRAAEAEQRRQAAEVEQRRAAALAEEDREARQQQAAALAPPSADDVSRLGNLRLPAQGRILVRYGETDRFGVVSRGLSIQARPGTTVVAPFSGHVQFAGPFKGYGQILIVEHGHGYHSLLAGLGRIDSAVGQQVSAGEPVGALDAPAEGTPKLYYELRRNGQPVNPQRGLSAQDGKGRG